MQVRIKHGFFGWYIVIADDAEPKGWGPDGWVTMGKGKVKVFKEQAEAIRHAADQGFKVIEP